MAKEKTLGVYRLFAMALGRQGKYEEALQVCREAAQKDSSPLPYITAAYAMLEGQPSVEDYERAEAFLGDAAETHRDSPELLNVLAALRIQESKIEEAAALLRRVVELRPRDVLAMNNLATVLVERPETLLEGKKLVEEAMAMAGPQAGIFDLQGVILLTEGKPEEAIPLFEKACDAPQADPRYWFHLAVAYRRIGNQAKSQESLKHARGLELEQQILTPSDKILLAELENAAVQKR
jgi:Flp pilus assembly protein TadD